MKYVDAKVVFREVPDEITLAVNISNCPVGCVGCHSSYLAQDIGEPLDIEAVRHLIESNPGISCFSFMGGDSEPLEVGRLADWIKRNHSEIKTCWYSGRTIGNARPVLPYLDFVKVGPYIGECGPLDSPTTNQRFYKVSQGSEGPELEDCTELFYRES